MLQQIQCSILNLDKTTEQTNVWSGDAVVRTHLLRQTNSHWNFFVPNSSAGFTYRTIQSNFLVNIEKTSSLRLLKTLKKRQKNQGWLSPTLKYLGVLQKLLLCNCYRELDCVDIAPRICARPVKDRRNQIIWSNKKSTEAGNESELQCLMVLCLND